MVESEQAVQGVYTLPQRWQKGYRVLGLIEMVASAGLLILVLARPGHSHSLHVDIHNSSDILGLTAFLAFIVGGPALGLIISFRGPRVSVTLTSEVLEIHDLFRSRTLRISEIAGQRRKLYRNGPRTVLVTGSATNKNGTPLPEGVVFDQAFDHWLASIPDLDATDKEKRRAAGKLH
jgi:hypothetical protein